MSGQRASYLRRQTAFRWASIIVAVTFFLLPLLGALEFTTQGPGGNGHTAELALFRQHWPAAAAR